MILSDGHKKLMRAVTYNFKTSQADVKHCYYLGCESVPIQSHSISEKRVLDKISKNGVVLMPKTETFLFTKELARVGVSQASTSKSFCSDHDQKIFALIDNEDYVVGNTKQEFLFAFRAAAREFLTKEAAVQACCKWQGSDYIRGDSGAIAMLDRLNVGQELSVKDQDETRAILVDTYQKEKYNVIRTACIIIDGCYPIAASSSFCLELDMNGKLVNDISESGYDTKMKPCFLTVFPQEDKTYCLISYFNRDRKAYNFLKEINGMSNQDKGVIVSNILANYVENFAVSPSYWEAFPDKDKFFDVLWASKTSYARFIEDECLNLFMPTVGTLTS